MSMFYKLLLILVLACGTLPAAAQDWQTGKSPLTQTQASQIAANFLKRIGQPASGAGAAHLAAPSAYVSGQSLLAQEASRQLCWEITFADQVHPKIFKIRASDGLIIDYMRQTNVASSEPLGSPISKAQAIAQATSALVNAGAMRTKELTFKEASLDRGSVDSAFWFVSWARSYHRMPYREQDANVIVDSQTGEVTMFGVNFHTPPPDSAALNISRDQAQKIADEQMARAGIQSTQVPRIQTEVVQPNGYWEPGGSEAERKPYARVSWTCHYAAGTQSYEVWVDAASGDIIGGQYVGRRARGVPGLGAVSANGGRGGVKPTK